MRIQYRYQRIAYTFSATEPWRNGSSIGWSEWADWPRGGIRPTDLVGEMQTRMVDDYGNEVLPTPPFKPAYYQRKGNPDGKPGGITWCTAPPKAEHWVRRDDIKP